MSNLDEYARSLGWGPNTAAGLAEEVKHASNPRELLRWLRARIDALNKRPNDY